MAAGALLLGCLDSAQGPSGRSRSRPPLYPEDSDRLPGPVDLVYICGNKFLATNQTALPVQVVYRVVGSDETGSLSLRAATQEDEGFSETELETVERGVVELYHEDELVTRRGNQGLACGPAPSSASFAATATNASVGEWSAPFAWDNIAVHLSLLPTGKVLSWGLSGIAQVWDPATGHFSPNPAPAVIFCSGHAFLPDGRLLVTGGNNDPNVALNGIPDITIFTPSSQSWSRASPMRYARWYPTSVTLANGDIAIISGRDAAGVMIREPEVWSSGTTRVLNPAPVTLPLYPRAFLAPNGRVFVAENATSRYLDPTTGSWTAVAPRLYGAREYGSAVMYEPGKVLYAGGGRTTNTAETINLNSPTPTWQLTGAMAFARRHLNATLLPTGEVLVTGGTSGTTFNDPSQAVLATEIWDPNTETWTRLASNAIPRVYHSTSMLLPDGRVLHTGSGDAGPDQRNAELFSPPYLFKGERPTITTAPGAVRYGTSFSVSTPQAAEIAKVSLIRIGSVTHAFNMNQRFQWLSFQASGSALSIAAPSSGNLAPPGHYLLFLLNGNGVPSVAKIVKLGLEGDPPPTNTAPAASFTNQCLGLDCTFSDASADTDGQVTGWSWDFGDGSSATESNPTHSYAAEGSYEVTLTVTDDDQATGTITRTVAVTPPPPNTAPTADFTQSCDGFDCSFTDASADADGSVIGRSWDFGDGDSATEANPSHTFAGEGEYQVSLTVTDDDQATGTITKTVTVTPPPPNSAPTAEFSQTCHGFTCSFNDASSDGDGSLKAWSWEFGDQNSATSQNPSHTYPGEGSYDVILTVTDNDDATGSITHNVTVTPPPPNDAPTADFSETCQGLTCSFTDRSTDNDGTVKSWSWDFGDGNGATEQNLSHTYAAAGTYEVKLTVTDNDDAPATVTRSVTVSPPPNNPPTAGFAASCTELTCTFTDGSTDGDGTVVSWSWSFGDGGSETVRNPSHTYGAGGTYPVTLRVTDDDGATSEKISSVTVTAPVPNRAPTAAFTHSCTGLTCRFTDRSTDTDGTVTAWRWTFGNGTSALAQNPTRTYATAGIYLVTLRVTDDDGATHQTSISVNLTTNLAPRAAFVAVCPTLTCRFTDQSTDADGTLASWRWTFGNGTSSTIRSPSRTYASAGTYPVTLRVTDNRGVTAQSSATITVATSGIVLNVTGRVDATKQYMTLTWSRARGTRVDIYRDGRLLKNEVNDGRWTNSRLLPGATRYTYKVCEAGRTVCSNLATVAF